MSPETRNKVLVRAELDAGKGSAKQLLNLLANYMLGVSHDDDFRFELPLLSCEDDTRDRFYNDDKSNSAQSSYLIAFPRQEDSQVQYNVLALVLGKLDVCSSIGASPVVKSLLESKVIHHVDSYIVSSAVNVLRKSTFYLLI